MKNKFTKEFILQALDFYREDLNTGNWKFHENSDGEVYIKINKGHSLYMGDLEFVDKCCYYVGEYVIDAGNNYKDLLVAHLELLNELQELKRPKYDNENIREMEKYYSDEDTSCFGDKGTFADKTNIFIKTEEEENIT